LWGIDQDRINNMIRRIFRFEDEDYLKGRREPWVCYVGPGDGPDSAGGEDLAAKRAAEIAAAKAAAAKAAADAAASTPTPTPTPTPTTTNTSTRTSTTTGTTTKTTGTAPVYTKPKAPTPADEVASAQDAVAGMPTLGDPSKIPDPAQRTVNVQELVEYRMSQMMQDDNPYLQASVSRAKQLANQSGMLNTSIAASAGVDAAIKSILPIAQQDAATLHGQALENQRAVNEFLMQDYMTKNQFKLTEFGYKSTTYNSALQQAHEQNEALIQRHWQGQQNTFDRELTIWRDKYDAEIRKILASMGIDADVETGESSCRQNAYARWQAEVMKIEAAKESMSTEAYNQALGTAEKARDKELASCG
jgi:hypothetical protein